MPDSLLSRLRRRLRRIARGGGLIGPPLGLAPVILLYHRVADPPFDPWTLAVTPERFREHMAWLKANRVVLPVDELVALLGEGRAPEGAAAVTFDDGYADNATEAAAILEELGVPATIFLATGAVASARPFWWDELGELLFSAEGAGQVELGLKNGVARLSWGADRVTAKELRNWRAGDPPPESRCKAYLELWTLLQRLDPTARAEVLDGLRTQLSVPRGQEAGAPMSKELVRSLASGLITIGGHARSHVPLTGLEASALDTEIAGGRADVAELTANGAPSGFAYPHGSWDAATRQHVVAAGYSWALAVGTSCIDPRRFDRFALPRLPVGDWDAKQLEAAIIEADR